jgi:hypothetical protein
VGLIFTAAAIGVMVAAAGRWRQAPSLRSTCVDSRITCGDVVTDTTIGTDPTRFSAEDYERWICWPRVVDRDRGGERVHALTLQPDQQATITLRPQGEDLDLAAILTRHCPADTTERPPSCEMWPKPGAELERVTLQGGSIVTDWLVVVEGAEGREGAYTLEVACTDAGGE